MSRDIVIPLIISIISIMAALITIIEFIQKCFAK